MAPELKQGSQCLSILKQRYSILLLYSLNNILDLKTRGQHWMTETIRLMVGTSVPCIHVRMHDGSRLKRKQQWNKPWSVATHLRREVICPCCTGGMYLHRCVPRRSGHRAPLLLLEVIFWLTELTWEHSESGNWPLSTKPGKKRKLHFWLLHQMIANKN